MRIHFQGADYYAEAWLNGEYLGGNESGLPPFAFDAKRALRSGTNRLVVRVIDAYYAKEIDGFKLGRVPGGRQHDDPLEPGWRHQIYGGLLLPVTLQAFRRPWIADGFVRPDVARSLVTVDLRIRGAEGTAEWLATIRPASSEMAAKQPAVVVPQAVRITPDAEGLATISVGIASPRLWSVWDGFPPTIS